MPVCPKCGKLISAGHYERHLKRCGEHHKRPRQDPYVPSFTPSFESAGPRGVLLNAPTKPKLKKHRSRIRELLGL